MIDRKYKMTWKLFWQFVHEHLLSWVLKSFTCHVFGTTNRFWIIVTVWKQDPPSISHYRQLFFLSFISQQRGSFLLCHNLTALNFSILAENWQKSSYIYDHFLFMIFTIRCHFSPLHIPKIACFLSKFIYNFVSFI